MSLNFLFQFGQRFDPERDDFISQAYDVTSFEKKIYVVDRGRKLLKIYSDDGKLLKDITKIKFPDGEEKTFMLPQHVKVDVEGRIYLANSEASRIFVFDENGNAFFEFETKGYLKDIAILDDSTIVAAEFKEWRPGYPKSWKKIGGLRKYEIISTR